MRSHARRLVVLLTAAVAGLAIPGAATGSDTQGQVAVFEGDLVDLSISWGGATACVVSDDGSAECFDSEGEMEERIEEMDAARGLTASNAVCSTPVRLYDGTNYTGAVLALRGRATWVNLSGHGFSNRTSSFRMGTCSGYFADLNNGGGSWYSESSTTAGRSVLSMASGWDNRISSVYLR